MMPFKQKLNLAAKLTAANLVGKKYPLALWVDVTNRCPARCVYCDLWGTGKKDMPLKDIISLIDQASEVGTVRMHFTGGDPLMRDDIDEIISHAKAKRLYVSSSVCAALAKKRIGALKKADMVFLSFDGPQEVHDYQKGFSTFKYLIDAFELLAAEGVSFQTTTTLTKKNKDHIEFILDTAKKYNFGAAFQGMYYPPGAEYKNGNPEFSPNLKNLLLEESEYHEIGKKLIGLKKQGEPIVSSYECLTLTFLNWPDHTKIFLPHPLKKGVKCWAGKLFSYVDVDGFVYPCGAALEISKNRVRVNFRDVGFKKAFEGLSEETCFSCMKSCFIETNLMFSLKLGPIINWNRALRAL